MPMLERLEQYLVKIQSVAGTAESLAAADGKTRVDMGMGFDPQEPPVERQVARDVLSSIGILAGEKAGGITAISEINNPDLMTNLPEQEPLIRSCGVSVTPTRRIPIGAITGGPMLRNATLTGGTSSATGRLLLDTVNGAPHLYFSPISGSFISGEVITATGGGTATSSAISAVYGARANPVSTFVDFVTAEFQQDGFAYSIRDAMGDMSFDVEASKQGKFKFVHLGAKAVWGTKAMTSGIAYDVGEPSILQTAGLKIASFSPVFSKLGFALGNKVVLRKDGNSPDNTGIRGSRINSRDSRFKITVEHELQSVYDFYAAYDAQTRHDLRFQLGTVVGKRFFFFAAEAQFAGPPKPASLDGIVGLDCEFILPASAKLQGANGEWEALWL